MKDVKSDAYPTTGSNKWLHTVPVDLSLSSYISMYYDIYLLEKDLK